MQPFTVHQYIERSSGAIMTEDLYCDRVIAFLYSTLRENAAFMFKTVISARMSALLAFCNYDLFFRMRLTNPRKLIQRLGINRYELAEPAEALSCPQKLFERKIKYWKHRPMPANPSVVVSPADAKMVVGSLQTESMFFLKAKFFHFEELIGRDKIVWLRAFHEGNYAIFRLTPEKYHYNHVPVSGKIIDIYTIDGSYHSCNPGAVIREATPFSKNRRVVTIIDTDVPGGAQMGLVGMVEVTALMIGDIRQCYSNAYYDAPRNVTPGLFVSKGRPKSLYRPGSSVDVLFFQKGRVEFCRDILANMRNLTASSRFTRGFGQPLVETDIKVRAAIGKRIANPANRKRRASFQSNRETEQHFIKR